MKKERVVITGLGTINAVSGSAPEFSAALKQGVCGIRPLTVFDTTGYRTRTGGEVKNLVPAKMLPPEFTIKRMSRSDIMAMAAALEALSDAGLFPFPDDLRENAGVRPQVIRERKKSRSA